jgi:hypothetical protein
MPQGKSDFSLASPSKIRCSVRRARTSGGTVRFQGSLVAKPARSLPLAGFLVYLPGDAVYYNGAGLSGGTP